MNSATLSKNGWTQRILSLSYMIQSHEIIDVGKVSPRHGMGMLRSRLCGAARPTGACHAGSDGLKLLVDAAMNADSKGARFSAAALPTWHFFLGGLALSLPAATRNGWCAWSR